MSRIARWRTAFVALATGIVLLVLYGAGPSRRGGGVSEPELWIAQGYGLLFEVSDSLVAAFEITSRSCISAWVAPRDRGISGSRVFTDGFESGEERFALEAGGGSDRLVLRRQNAIGDIALTRAGALPPTCGRSAANTPEGNFDVLWTTFSELYPSFPRRAIDWGRVDRDFRPRARMARSDHELFQLFREMLEPLHDRHVVIERFPEGVSLKKAWLKTATESFQGASLGAADLTEADVQRAEAAAARQLSAGPLTTFCNGKLRFRVTGDSIGYLEIRSFHGYADDDNFEAGLALLSSALDSIFRPLRAFNALIIDIRLNSGGEDPYGFLVASHLTDSTYPGWSKRVRIDPAVPSRFSSKRQAMVRPGQGPGFSGEVVLLTSRHTASAAETFSMALMGRRPSVLRIGENTAGVFSDVLDRRLPNGWRLVLPNEILVDQRDSTYDVTGIPPDLAVRASAARDLEAGTDAVLAAAMSVLRQRRPH